MGVVTLCLSAPATGDDRNSEVFEVLSKEELAAIQPALEEQHFNNGLPRLHRRHQVLRIDTFGLRNSLEKDFLSRQQGKESPGVTLRLFDDLAITVIVEHWRRGNFGITSASGRPKDKEEYGITSDFSAHFSDEGRLDLTVATDDFGIVVSSVRDFEHYVVIQLESWDGPID